MQPLPQQVLSANYRLEKKFIKNIAYTEYRQNIAHIHLCNSLQEYYNDLIYKYTYTVII